MIIIQLNDRLKKIIEIVRKHQPITGDSIASKLDVKRATLRPDLAVLTMSGILGAKPKVGYFYIGMEDEFLVSKKLNETKVEDIMSMPVVVTEDTTVYDTIVTMFLDDVGSVFVTENGYLSGVVSRKDLLKTTIGGKNINTMPIAMVMTRMPNVVMTEPEESTSIAAQKIIEHEVDSLPVIENSQNGQGKDRYKIIGRITKTNITRLYVELSSK